MSRQGTGKSATISKAFALTSNWSAILALSAVSVAAIQLKSSTGQAPKMQDARITVRYTDIRQDRKSTRLNSSHVSISYAVFCLNKNVVQPKGKKTIANASGSTKIPSTHGDFFINLTTDHPQSRPDMLTAPISTL